MVALFFFGILFLFLRVCLSRQRIHTLVRVPNAFNGQVGPLAKLQRSQT